MRQTLKKPLEVFKKLYFGLNLLRHLSKKQYFLIVGGLIVVAIMIPAHYARAEAITLATVAVIGITALVTAGAGAVAGYLVDKLTAATLIAGILGAIILFGQAVLSTGSAMFSWAINNPLGVSLTNPANNPIIQIGWTLIRDLTNMFFILGLAYIGLATALNISGFNTKKTFAKLLLFALLINFTPVIAGVIVDTANIVTDFFLSSVDFSELGRIETDAFTKWDKVKEAATAIVSIEFWIKFFMKNVFYMVTGITLWIFALLFLMRHFAIWFLVILSPLAFFAGIFEFGKAKEIYKKWWQQFIAWSFIAVPAGFFLYLGRHFMAGVMESKALISTSGQNLIEKFLSNLAPYFIVMIFLVLALFATFKTNAIGSKVILGAATKTFGKVRGLPKKAGAAVGAVAGSAAGAFVGSAAGGAIAGRQQDIAERKEADEGFIKRQLGSTRAAFRGARTKEGREKGQEFMEENRRKLWAWAERSRLAPVGTGAERREKQLAIDETKKRGQKMTEEDINAQLAVEAKQPKHMAEQLGLIRAKIEQNHDLTERDKEILQKYSYLDGGKTRQQAIFTRPDWEPILKPDEAEEKTIERYTGWNKEAREKEYNRLRNEGATQEEAQARIDQRERQVGTMTKAEAEAKIKEDKETALNDERDKIRRQAEVKGEEISDTEIEKRAQYNLRMEAPHIEQDIKIEIIQERLDRMNNKQIGELQVDNPELLMALDAKHIKTLSERATLKQLRQIDELLAKEKAKGEESVFMQRVDELIEKSDDANLSEQERERCLDKTERLLSMGEAVEGNPRFLYGGAGSEETVGEAEERQRRERTEQEETEAAEQSTQAEQEEATSSEGETS